jgi:hypothetical protein
MRNRMLSSALRRVRGAAPSPAAPPGSATNLDGIAPEDQKILTRALPYTMTGVARLHALVDAVRYCIRRDVPGAFAECGVWLGGSVLAMILTLQELGVSDRDIYLYDTFEGMTAPTEHDVSPVEPPAKDTWEAAAREQTRPWQELFDPDGFSEAKVRATILATSYPAERVHFVRGPVEETLPTQAPPHLALLRLDTDWYESTRHELQHLYPLLVEGGVIIIDDYGHWEGCRRAVDEYFAESAAPLLLNRIDYTGRIAVKQ